MQQLLQSCADAEVVLFKSPAIFGICCVFLASSVAVSAGSSPIICPAFIEIKGLRGVSLYDDNMQPYHSNIKMVDLQLLWPLDHAVVETKPFYMAICNIDTGGIGCQYGEQGKIAIFEYSDLGPDLSSNMHWQRLFDASHDYRCMANSPASCAFRKRR